MVPIGEGRSVTVARKTDVPMIVPGDVRIISVSCPPPKVSDGQPLNRITGVPVLDGCIDRVLGCQTVRKAQRLSVESRFQVCPDAWVMEGSSSSIDAVDMAPSPYA